MFLVKPPVLVTKLFNKLIWNIPNDEKKIFLTFDDGPVPETTEWILNILDFYQAKATFFCVGENVRKHQHLYNKYPEQGHSVGNHTFNHMKGWKHSNANYFENIETAENLIHSQLFRPPHGRLKYSQKEYLKKNYYIIMWDVLSRDYDATISKEACYLNVVNHAKEGSIIVFHDSVKASANMMYALPKVLEYFSNLGYRFAPITSGIIRKSFQYKSKQTVVLENLTN
jgi:peptidoglycan-N-acetylglucosamine deacetylase